MIDGRKSVARLREALCRVGLDGSTSSWGEVAELARPHPVERTPGPMKARKHKFLILLLVQLAFFSCIWLVARRVAGVLYPHADTLSYRLVLPLVLFFLTYFLHAWRAIYSRDYHYYLRRAHGKVLKHASLPVVMGCFGFLVLQAWRTVPVPLLILFLAAGFTSFAAADGCQYLWIRYLGHLGYFRKKILVIGRSGLRHTVDTRVRDFGSTKIYAGEIDRTNGAWLWKPASGEPTKVVKGFPQIRTIILKENIGDILLFPGAPADRAFERDLVDYCQAQSIGYYIVPERTQARQTGIASLFFPTIPVSMRFAGPRDSLTAVSAKRLLDIVISSFCLALFLPFGLLIALVILLREGRPVLYVSARVGKNGRPIHFLKFRTMVRGADRQKESLLPFNARGDGPLFKMKNDPRVTATGGLLRRYSLDEFPQFLNVLLGSMSLVGPRPHLPEEVAEYREGDYLRLECMPGIVGLPQVSGSGTTMGFREWVDLDLAYRRGWSLALDMNIIVKTVSLFFRGLFSGRGSDHF